MSITKLGFNTAGTEQAFQEMLDMAIASNGGKELFAYLEIGVAEGTTLAAVARHLAAAQTLNGWNCIGIDLLDGPFFNPVEFMRNNRDLNIHILLNSANVRLQSQFQKSMVEVVLNRNEHQTHQFPDQSIDFCLIDGCHGAQCVVRDFMMVELLMRPGGIVAFHDAGEWEQGKHFQAHCGEPINVRQALTNLGLLAKLSRHSPWAFLGMANGNTAANPPGHSFAFFQKTMMALRVLRESLTTV